MPLIEPLTSDLNFTPTSIGLGSACEASAGVAELLQIEHGLQAAVETGLGTGVGVLVGVDIGVLVGVDVGVLVGVDVGAELGADVSDGRTPVSLAAKLVNPQLEFVSVCSARSQPIP